MSATYEGTSKTRDQQNRLVRFLQGAHESVYEYDGESHRVRIKELTSSVETKNETFVWCGDVLCQKRSGSTISRNYFDEGFEQGSSDYFYTRDLLGSVREVVGSNGTTIASTRSYGPWGAMSESGSGASTDFGYAGMYDDRPSGLGLTLFRGYDSSTGRWLSQDPIGLEGGLNLYSYVDNDPVNFVDPLGLMPSCNNPNCFNQCIDELFADYIVKSYTWIILVNLPLLPTPKMPWEYTRFGGGGASRFTTWASRASAGMGAANGLRTAGRYGAYIAVAVTAFVLSYMATATVVCSLQCKK